jgi:hypothetical protein
MTPEYCMSWRSTAFAQPAHFIPPTSKVTSSGGDSLTGMISGGISGIVLAKKCMVFLGIDYNISALLKGFNALFRQMSIFLS